MIHRAHRDFWTHYRKRPAPTRELADRCFRMLKADPRHPSLRLKRVGNFWSVRVGVNYRAVAVGAPDGLTWVWIGPHDRYEGYIE